jgi:hypothetical protein
MFRYRLHSPDGDDLGGAAYAMMIKPGEEIIAGGNEHFRVIAVVPFDEEDESPLVGLLSGRGRVTVLEIRGLPGCPLPAGSGDSITTAFAVATPSSTAAGGVGARTGTLVGSSELL